MAYQPKVYRKQGGDELVVASGGKITIESGGELELAAGATLDLGDGLSAPGDITLASAKIIVGNGAGVGAAVSMSGDVTIDNTGATAIGAKKVVASMTAIADGKILIGGADGAGAAQTLTGDVTVTNGGVTAIGNGRVTSAMLTNGAGLAALVAAGLGASAAYAKTTNGVQTLAAGDAAARTVLIVVTVDEVFATGDNAQTTFKIGETDADDKFAATATFTDAAAGTVFVFAGSLTATKALIVTANDAAGTGTGGISVTALILPATV
jgi:hypothetical protein